MVNVTRHSFNTLLSHITSLLPILLSFTTLHWSLESTWLWHNFDNDDGNLQPGIKCNANTSQEGKKEDGEELLTESYVYLLVTYQAAK